MRRLPRTIGIVAAVGVAALLVAACGSSSSSSSASKSGTTTSAVNIAATGKPCTYKFALITHGDNGSFWSVVYKGAKDAAADLGCTLTETYGSQQQGQAEPDDNAENAQIQDAINAKVNGMAVSDHDPALMNPTLAKAAAAGIPVVLLNAGCDDQDIAASGALTCVGQPEQLAGEAAGAAFKKPVPRTSCASSTSRVRICSTGATESRWRSESVRSARPAARPRRARPAPR